MILADGGLSAILLSMLYQAAIAAGISMAVWYLSHKGEKAPPDIKPLDVEIPSIEEGRPYSVVFGSCLIKSYLISWWGDIETKAIWDHYHRTTKRGGPFNTKKKYFVAGWKYKYTAHFKLSLGPIDGVKRISMGRHVIAPTVNSLSTLAADGTTAFWVSAKSLFGGDKSMGGVNGRIRIQYGYSTQSPHSYLTAAMGSDIPASRGVVGVILYKFYYGTNPTPQECEFFCKRTDVLTDGTAQWYIAKAEINNALNPAHVIREAMTSNIFGLAHSTSRIDSTSFEASADTLYDEDFGISYEWNPKAMPLDKFIEYVLSVINGVCNEDLTTGKFTLNLARDDYSIPYLETFSTDDIIEVEEFYRELTNKITNEVTVHYRDYLTGSKVSVTVHDIAMIDREGEIVSMETDFKCVHDDTLAIKLAQRELRQASSNVPNIKLRCKRTMQHIRPNDIFILTWPKLGIDQLILRVVTVDYGSLTEGDIILQCTEDIYKPGSALYSDVPSSGWTDPISEPAAAPARVLTEVPYYDILIAYGSEATALLDANTAFLMVAAMTPSTDALDYELLVRDEVGDDFISDGDSDFTPTGTLVGSMPLSAADIDITLTGEYDIDEEYVGTYALIENECVLINSIDEDTLIVNVSRGVLDTVPAAHASTTRVWFIGARSAIGGSEYTNGDTPAVKILPRTSKGQFAEGSASIYTATAFDDRMIRPYPPGDLKVNSVSYPASFSGQPTITWNHRNRLTQADEIVLHSAASITPETNNTYTLKIYNESDTLVRTESGLTGETYTYSVEDEMADSSIPSGSPLNTSLRFVLTAVRDGYDSWQSYDITVNRV